MSVQAVSNRLFTAPSGADAVIITPNASAWSNSAWATVLASADADLVLTGICVLADTTAEFEAFEIDIATGAAASEVVVTTFRGVFKRTYFCGPGFIPLVIPLDNIASGARVSARLRKSNTTTNTWTLSLSYYKKPIVGSLLTTANPQKVTPVSVTSYVVPQGSGSWASGAWAQLIASVSADIVLTGVTLDMSAFGGDGWEVDLGIGAAASEAAILTFKSNVASLGGGGGPNVVSLYTPYDAIPMGSRLSARARYSTASGFRTVNMSLLYVEKPL